MLLLVAADAYLQVKYDISAFGFSSALNNCLTIFSSLLKQPEVGPFALIFCLLGVVAFPSQELPGAAKLSSCCWGELLTLTSLAGRLPGCSSREQGTHPVCDPKGLPVDQVQPVVPHTGLAAAFHFSLGIGILTWMLCSHHCCKVFVTLGRWSELFSEIINQIPLVTTTSHAFS